MSAVGNPAGKLVPGILVAFEANDHHLFAMSAVAFRAVSALFESIRRNYGNKGVPSQGRIFPIARGPGSIPRFISYDLVL